MDYTEMKSQIDTLMHEKEKIDSQISSIKRQYIQEHCPYKVGQKIIRAGYEYEIRSIYLDLTEENTYILGCIRIGATGRRAFRELTFRPSKSQVEFDNSNV